MASSPSSQPQSALDVLADDVRTGFGLRPRRLSPLFLYDALGSALFDAICRLPWYRITRSEAALLQAHAREIIATMAGPLRLIELGPGNGEKGALLVHALREREQVARVDLVDISPAALALAQARFSAWDGVEVRLREASYEAGLADAAAEASRDEPLLVLFLGSNLGNFSPSEAAAFLRDVRGRLRPGDGLLLGVDLIKPEKELLLAYDDPLGVTAAFNKNVLVRLNRELGADFDVAGFTHRAVWNAGESRVEMHLVSERRQDVSIPGAGVRATFESGDSLWTESSHKFSAEGLDGMLGSAGFRRTQTWHDPDAGFMNAVYHAV